MKSLMYTFIVIGVGMLVFSFVVAENPLIPTLRIMGIFFIAGPLLLWFMKSQHEKAHAEKKTFYEKNGIKAIATLTKVEKTGKYSNRRPELLFDFKVKPLESTTPDVVEFNTSVKKYVDISDRPKLTQGMEIEAYIHPEKHQEVFLLWEKAGIEDVTFKLKTE